MEGPHNQGPNNNVRLSGQFNHVPKPPRPNMNGTPLYEDSSAAGDSYKSQQKNNYRKVFKP